MATTSANGITLLDDTSAATEAEAVRAARQLLATLGMKCEDESTRDTPRRLAEALLEMTEGTTREPRRHLQVTFPPVGRASLIIAADISFTSVCEHHMLPFTGQAVVAYLPSPGAEIVGISKLARIVHEYAARPQMQERIGEQVVDALTECLDTQGAGCILRAGHACMTLRGARAHGAKVTTQHVRGVFQTDGVLRNQLIGAMADR
ncbi:GTP cyclohydrolase I [Streptomyces sp. V4I23]|uniref:GTP cyclohydrolase I n=1 Tax=Streptomyces sp. V4I23 TaxID=3042282 RepID=UPI00277E5C45|nr:GTP cyclohydrolase I [Streptomyces sp. V4I23]MDQ1005986.1 GTP cyclohydrolase I [Streptomyces sp. V4I23]